ncbi:hypothetical protein [Sulfobacillus harzensis]|uniref:Uncharacterized protein n=1 Tax=Sulfobacillus harzensis TaxID=2729629 RepID=A0A7Y0Q3X1_9FIRM|nr:hypothetical protein [Sulfobacillus harzensis]NMP23810.1 hypothetical protein [Sulfobacillus harzensis]
MGWRERTVVLSLLASVWIVSLLIVGVVPPQGGRNVIVAVMVAGGLGLLLMAGGPDD